MNAAGATRDSAEPAREAAPVLSRARALRLHKRCACGGEAGLAGDCDRCSGRLGLQRRGAGGAAGANTALGAIPQAVASTLAQPGRPLDSATRGFMEGRFGRDFSAVRVHDDAPAAQSAREVNALAYTVGQDIVFAPGQYQPHSHSGQHLLAHELAHTVQQSGLQRSGSPALADQGPEYRRMEVEADHAADAVLRGGRAVPALGAAPGPVLSRTPAPASAPAATPIDIEAAGLGPLHFEVTPDGPPGDGGTAPAQRRFRATPFHLPGQKGERARDVYQGFAQAGQLQAVLQIVGTAAQRTAQWQQRDRTSVLGDSWVQSVRWTAANRDANWTALSGGSAFPASANGTCNIDHIVELQVSGANDPANMQALDAEPNQFSGRAIWQQVSGLGSAIARQFNVAAGSQVQVIFSGVEVVGALEPHTLAPGRPPSCLAIDRAARTGVESRPVTDAAGAAARSVRLNAGASVNHFVIPTDWGAANRDAPLAANAANAASAQMISGFVLNQLRWVSATHATVAAQFDPRSRTRLPLTVAGERGNTIDLAATKESAPAAAPAASAAATADAAPAAAAGPAPVTYRLALADRSTAIAFNYPYLSPGRITRIGFAPDGAMHFDGYIEPTLAFLPRRLNVSYRDEQLRVGVALDRSQLRSPLPGFMLTDARLELGLSPLTASGNLAFAIGRGERAIATGSVDVGADSDGLNATGRLQANIPGVDEAAGEVRYRGGAWSAQIVVESSQIRLPNVQRGRLQLDIDDSGLRPSGELELLLPRNLGDATLGFTREGARFVYSGRGTLRVPGLHEVTMRARYDGSTLTAGAENIGFRWRGLDGRVDVNYVARGSAAGTISGHGRLVIARGDVTGNVDVTLHDSGRFSGSGRVSYPFNIRGQRLDAAAGITIDEAQNVRVEGSLRFPQPIELFRRFGDSRRLFHFQRSIPIPGLSIGPVGVVAVIEGGISARYSFGPGQLRNVALEGAFNPLAEHIDPDVSFHADLHVPAEAGIAGTIGGGIGVEAGLGRVNGTLTVTADLGVNAVLGGPLDLRYASRRFELTARPGIDASLGLGLSLDAHARAEAGIGPFTVGVEKDWNLGRRQLVLGRFSMFAPISWSSDRGFEAPTLDQIEWGPAPEIDPADLLSQLFRSSSASQRDT